MHNLQGSVYLLYWTVHRWHYYIYLHNDVVDGDVDQFDKETNETHDGKSDSCCHGNLLELCTQIKRLT